MTTFELTEQSLSQTQIEQRRLQSKSFPNQISAGSFTPHSTLIEVACFRTAEVKQAMLAENLMPVRNDIQVLCHEMTHWLDFFGTVWGRGYIGKICRAYRASLRGTEPEFPHIVRLFDEDRKVLAPAYYRFVNAPSETHTSARPWLIEYVSGIEIDPNGLTREDKPIFMAKFRENRSNQVFARQPVSIGALLEVRAIASEIQSAFAAVNTHPEDGPRSVEIELASREFNQLAYDHELIEYNAAAHILSVNAGTKELFLTARLAAALAYIALNLTRSDFNKLKVPDGFAWFGNRNKAFKKRLDRGYAFVAMIFNGGKFDGDEENYIKRCVETSNLGAPEQIIEAAAKELGKPFRLSGENEITAHFARETRLSRRILEIHSKLPHSSLTLESLLTDLRTVCPPFVDSEANFVELHKGRINDYQPEMMHDAAHDLHKHTRNLLTGCRGI